MWNHERRSATQGKRSWRRLFGGTDRAKEESAVSQVALPGVWAVITPGIFVGIILFGLAWFGMLLRTKGTDRPDEVWREAAQEYDERGGE